MRLSIDGGTHGRKRRRRLGLLGRVVDRRRLQASVAAAEIAQQPDLGAVVARDLALPASTDPTPDHGETRS
jgi:hypothetical protein